MKNYNMGDLVITKFTRQFGVVTSYENDMYRVYLIQKGIFAQFTHKFIERPK